ncbi:MAG: hypothetical protein Q9219_004247 [cf. Caloplaca sp. 3 TL-2023]
MRPIVHSFHLISTAEALQRVFLPSLKPHPKTLPRHDLARQGFPAVRRRYATFSSQSRSQVPAQSQDNSHARDEAIGPQRSEVQVVNADGSLQPPATLRDALASMDRSSNFLIQVGRRIHPWYANGPESEEGKEDTRPRIPVCKVISKTQFRLSQAAKSKPRKDAVATSKEVEMRWTMAPNDLNHRLERLKEFLSQGRRVEVTFGKKRKGWKNKKEVTEETAENILKEIRDKALEVEGVREWKSVEGELRGVLIMHFEGKKEPTEVKKKQPEGDYKVKKKFQEAHKEKMYGFSPAAK